MGDVLGGLNLTVGVLAALVNKQRTGLGEKVDVALVDSVASAMENITMIYQSTGRIPQRIGNRYESTYPYDVFPASDGDVVIAAGNAKLWKILCSVMGSPELADAPQVCRHPGAHRKSRGAAGDHQQLDQKPYH